MQLYRKAFLKSRHHLWTALLTVGIGFATGEPLGLLAGVTAYALAWVFLPDAGFFKRWVDQREASEREKVEAAKWAEFQQQHEKLLNSLSPARRKKYTDLSGVCAAIESASQDVQNATGLELESRLRKLDELLWTYLRMLSVEQNLEVFLESERKEQVPQLLASLETETRALSEEVAELKKISPAPAAVAVKERLLTSRLERLAGLKQRVAKIEQSQANLELMRSEQDRLVEQVKLIRADAVASKNADALSARIDLSIEHLATTNQWLSEITEFKDVTQQMPDIPTQYRTKGATLLKRQTNPGAQASSN
jgi:hypothetical protein